MAQAAGRTAARQLYGGSFLTPVHAFGLAMADFCSDPLEGLEYRRAKRVVVGLYDYVRSGSHQMEGCFERWAVSEAAFQMDARLIDLEGGFEGFEFLVDDLNDGLGGDVIAVGEVYFHGASG